MNKLLIGVLVVFAWASVQADDLKIADDFKSGDLVSADTFNQIFDTIEKINRTVKDSDLVGVWSCNAMTTRSTTDWTNKGMFYILENAQVNLTASSAETSLESAYSISTSTPSPFKRQSGSFTGTYVLYKNKLFTKHPDESDARIWDVNIVSPTRFELTFLETSAQSFPAQYSSFMTCDSATAVPAAPTSPTVVNNKTSLNLAWTDASSDETGFKVYRKLSTESEARLVATQTAVTYSDTGLTEGQTAYYHVTAYNDNGESAKTKTVSATIDSILPSVVSVTPVNNATLTDADADFTGGDSSLINGVSGSRNGGGTVTLVITFSEKVKVGCLVFGGAMSDMCTDNPAIQIKGNNNTYYFLDYNKEGTSFTTTIPFTPSYGSNPDTFVVTVNSKKIKDMNGNAMESDYTWTFTVSDTNTYGSKSP